MIPIQKINYVEIMMVICNKLAFSTTRKYLLQETQSEIKIISKKRQAVLIVLCRVI